MFLEGGPGVVIQIDELLFNFQHQPKVTEGEMDTFMIVIMVTFNSFQHHRGRPTTNEVWVFGMVDTSHQLALEVVSCRDAATLPPIIQAHTAAGSTVHSDNWAAYRQVQQLSNVSTHVVNHSLHFVDPATGVHTQNMERDWDRVKTSSPAAWMSSLGETNMGRLEEKPGIAFLWILQHSIQCNSLLSTTHRHTFHH